MGKRAQTWLGAALVVLAALGVWQWLRAPEGGEAGPPAREPTLAEALLSIEVILPDAAERSWLTDELRYLTTRARVALARPQGPYEPGSGTPLFTLRVSGEPDRGLVLSLVDPEGQAVRSVAVDPARDRLARMQAVAEALPGLFPRGETGIEPSTLLGTDRADAYETLAVLRMALDGTPRIRQSSLVARDSVLDRLVELTRDHPRFARAWSELAHLYLRIEGEDSRALTTLAEQAAARALELDARLADAHAALGIARQRRGEWPGADESFTQALAHDPAAPLALQSFTCLLADSGRMRYAALLGEQAVAVAPDSPQAAECLAYARAGLANAATPAGPAEPVSLLDGRVDPASGVPEGTAAGTDSRLATLFATVARAVEDARFTPAAMRAITQAASNDELDPVTELVLGIRLGQADFVFNRLQRLRADGGDIPLRLLWLRQTAFLREHPRFPGLVAAFGLDAYWEAREKPDVCLEAPPPAFCPSGA